LACEGRAGPIYSYAFDQPNYRVTAGGTVEVKLFLQEDDSAGGSAFLKNVGLIGAGVLVTFDDPTATQPAQVLSTADIFFNLSQFPGPPDPLPLLTAGVSAGLTEDVGLEPPVKASGPGPVYQVCLGTLRFTAGNVAGDVTHLTAARTAADSQDDVGADLPPTVLDSLVQDGAATITVSGPAAAVPEPSSFMLLGIGAALVASSYQMSLRRGTRSGMRQTAFGSLRLSWRGNFACRSVTADRERPHG
jgi:hypothetical protein